MTEPKTCLVIGAGAGIGGTVGKKFAEEGYHAALCRRSDIDGLNGMVEGLQGSGLSLSLSFIYNFITYIIILKRVPVPYSTQFTRTQKFKLKL